MKLFYDTGENGKMFHLKPITIYKMDGSAIGFIFGGWGVAIYLFQWIISVYLYHPVNYKSKIKVLKYSWWFDE